MKKIFLTSILVLAISLNSIATNTNKITQISSFSATGGGTVTSDGGSPVTARGVCWSTSPNPTLTNAYTTDGTGTGTFVSTLTGLLPLTTYYVRAYATNNIGTSYGNQVVFSTPTGQTPPVVITAPITVYPNPASSYINIQLKDGVMTPKSIEIYSILGRCVYRGVMNTDFLHIDIVLPKGMYVVMVQGTSGKIVATKVMFTD